MNNILYLIAIVFLIAWFVGYFGYHAGGGIIHVLLMIACIAVILRVIKGDKII